MKTVVLSCCLALMAAPALAQEGPKPSAPPPTGICQHGPNRVVIAGLDPDEMKCQLVTAFGQVSELTIAMISLQAKLRMAQNDLAEAKADADKLRDELAKSKDTKAAPPASAEPAPAKP